VKRTLAKTGAFQHPQPGELHGGLSRRQVDAKNY
jgi:hypothetical protein